MGGGHQLAPGNNTPNPTWRIVQPFRAYLGDPIEPSLTYFDAIVTLPFVSILYDIWSIFRACQHPFKPLTLFFILRGSSKHASHNWLTDPITTPHKHAELSRRLRHFLTDQKIFHLFYNKNNPPRPKCPDVKTIVLFYATYFLNPVLWAHELLSFITIVGLCVNADLLETTKTSWYHAIDRRIRWVYHQADKPLVFLADTWAYMVAGSIATTCILTLLVCVGLQKIFGMLISPFQTTTPVEPTTHVAASDTPRHGSSHQAYPYLPAFKKKTPQPVASLDQGTPAPPLTTATTLSDHMMHPEERI